MHNEKAVKLAQQGNENMLEWLYTNNYGLIYSVAKRYAQYNTDAALDIDDYLQACYEALVKAVKNYDETNGVLFSTYLVPCLRTCCRRVSGYDGAKKAHLYTTSLNEISEETGRTPLELLEDNNAVDPCEAAEHWDEWRIVKSVIDSLPEEQRHVLYGRYLGNKSHEELSFNRSYDASLLTAAVRACRMHPKIRELIEIERANIFRHTTLTTFKNTRTSAVERAVIHNTYKNEG